MKLKKKERKHFLYTKIDDCTTKIIKKKYVNGNRILNKMKKKTVENKKMYFATAKT